MKTIIILLTLGFIFNSQAFASDNEVSGNDCFDSADANYGFGYSVIQKFNDHRYEIKANSNGRHAILLTKSSVFQSVGKFKIKMRLTASKAMPLANGFTNENVQIYTECGGDKASERKKKKVTQSSACEGGCSKRENPQIDQAKSFEPRVSKEPQVIVTPQKNDPVTDAYNKCTNECHAKFASQKKEALECYEHCGKGE